MTAEQFWELALALDGAVEGAHGGHADFRLGNKVFASLGAPNENFAMVKLTAEQQAEFQGKAPDVFQPAAGAWGRQGYTLVLLELAKRREVEVALGLAAEGMRVAVVGKVKAISKKEVKSAAKTVVAKKAVAKTKKTGS